MTEIKTDRPHTDLKTKNVLTEANDIVFGARRAYGHPLDNHANTAAFWTNYLWRRFGESGPVMLTVRDVCQMMILLKISRDANMPKEDNLVDIAGYALNVQVAEAEAMERSGEAEQDRQERNAKTKQLFVEALLPDQESVEGMRWHRGTHAIRDLGHGIAVLEDMHENAYKDRMVRLVNGTGNVLMLLFPGEDMQQPTDEEVEAVEIELDELAAIGQEIEQDDESDIVAQVVENPERLMDPYDMEQTIKERTKEARAKRAAGQLDDAVDGDFLGLEE